MRKSQISSVTCLTSLGDSGIFCSNYVLAAQQTQQLTKKKKKENEKKEEDDKSEGTKHLTKKDESGGALGPAIADSCGKAQVPH